jgi:hypothetical protein
MRMIKMKKEVFEAKKRCLITKTIILTSVFWLLITLTFEFLNTPKYHEAYKIHTIQNNETVWDVADKYSHNLVDKRILVNEIIQDNDLGKDAITYNGMKLIVRERISK